MNDGSPPGFSHRPVGWRGPWVFRKDTGRRTRAFVVVAAFFKLVDRLTHLTRLTNASPELSAAERAIITDSAMMLFLVHDFLQSRCAARHQAKA